MYNKNGIYWYTGRRKLQPIPYAYQIPPLHFLTGQKPPEIKYETVKRKVIEPEPIKAGVGQLF